MHIVNDFLWAIELSSVFGYLLFFLLLFFESLAFVGVIVPGTSFLILAGFLSARDVLGADILIPVLLVAILIGDGISFYLGRKKKWLFGLGDTIFQSKHLAKGEEFFKNHGNKSLLLGRFLGPIRPLTSFVAGLFEMSYERFYVLNTLSAVLWVVFYFAIGFFFGQAAKTLELWSTRIGIFILVLLVFFFIFYLLKRFIVRHASDIQSFYSSLWAYVKNAALQNAYVIKQLEMHPKFFAFWDRRFQRGMFTGLPLTFLFLAFLYVIFLFIGLIEDVLTSDTIVSTDMRINSLLLTFRHPGLVKFFLWITVLGRGQMIFVLLLLTTVIFWLWKKRFYVVSLWTTIVGSAIFSFLGKLAFHRTRPAGAIYMEKSFSFPSGHATMAVAYFGFLAYFFWMNLASWRSKINALFLSLFLIIMIGFSRVYLGVHFMSDVWGGYLLGLLWLIIGITLGEWIYSKIGGASIPYTADSRIKISTALLAGAGIAFYIILGVTFRPIYLLDLVQPAPVVVKDPIEIFTEDRFPKYSETLLGNIQEPASFIIVAKGDIDIDYAFSKAGWYMPEPLSIGLLMRISDAALKSVNYPTGPIVPAFWNSQVNDLAFQQPIATAHGKERRHVRIWNTGFKTADGLTVYMGTASLDVGLKWWIAHNMQPDIDAAREKVFTDILKTGLISDWKRVPFIKPVIEDSKDASDNKFFTDGKVYEIYLR